MQQQRPESGYSMSQRAQRAHISENPRSASLQTTSSDTAASVNRGVAVGVTSTALVAKKKRSSQASWSHGAWELLSPDLRCFCIDY
jgi:hypothetical protein